MNRYFEFSRRQLYCLAVLCTTAFGMSSYLAIHQIRSDRSPGALLPVFAGAAVDLSAPIVPMRGTFSIDPNTAPLDSLELLPGIGPSKAAAIIACRDTLPFASLDDLLNVAGIGRATLDKMRPFLKVTPR